MRLLLRRGLFLLPLVLASAALAAGVPRAWQRAWPETDFTKHSIDYAGILEGGPPKDGIPSIDRPRFESIDKAATWLSDRSPVIGLVLGGEARAYPLAILIQPVDNNSFAHDISSNIYT